MPIYAAKCHCGHREDFYAPVERYQDTPDHCGRPMTRLITAPHVIEDMKPYISPLDGKPVTSRKAHKDRMVQFGVIEAGNEKMTRPATKQVEPEGVEQDVYDAIKRVEELA